MRNPAEKIQFPAKPPEPARQSFGPDANKKPAARRVVIGITDSKSTQVASRPEVGDSVVWATAARPRRETGSNRADSAADGGGSGGGGRWVHRRRHWV
jgi:hypothetical protein